jgi:ATP-dependent Zn protease
MRLGMDASTGLRVFPDPQEQPVYSLFSGSQKTHETIDEAVNNILATCYGEARQILMDKRGLVERVSSELLEVETINRERFEQLVN